MLPDKLIRELSAHKGAVHGVRFTHCGNYCMSCSEDRTVILWNPHRESLSDSNSALQIKSYAGVHGYQILDIAISNDNSKFASCGGDKTVFVWDISSARVIRRLQGHNHRVNTVCMNTEGTILCSGSYDKSVAIWDLRSHTRDPIQILTSFKDSVTSIINTSNEIIVGCVDGILRTFDIRNGRCHNDDLNDPITCVRVSHDERCLLSTCLSGKLKLNEIASGKLLQNYSGHIHQSYKLESEITNDDAHVVGGSENGKVFYWDIVTGGIVKEFDTGHTGAVSTLSYHPKHSALITGSSDGTIRFWGS